MIAAICRDAKRLSLVEEFLGRLGANMRAQKENIIVMLDSMSAKGTECLPAERSKAICNGLFELRTKDLRLFYFKDDERRIILTNGYVKSGQKADSSEIERGQRLKAQYEDAEKTKTVIWEKSDD